MHFLIHGVGTSGDVLPFIGIGRALRRRGHQVTLMANDHFRRMAEEAELDFHSLGPAEDYFRVILDPALWHPSQSFKTIAASWILPQMGRTCKFIRQVYEPGRTRAIGSAAAFGARLAQEKLGIPLYSIVVSPFILPSVFDSLVFRGWASPSWTPRACKAGFLRLLDYTLDRLLAPSINELRMELGLPRLTGSVRSWWFSPDVVMALFPEWFAARQPDWPEMARAMDFAYYDADPGNGTSSPAQTFLEASGPFVVFARGSVASGSEYFFAESVEACRRLKMRALLLGGEKPSGRLPAEAAWFPYVPLGQALKSAAAIVHHGGIGTVSLSLSAGVPQVAVPFGHDQFDNAARLKRLGVAKTIPRGRYTAESAGNALREMLGSRDFVAQARSLAMRCSPADSLEKVCDVIES